MELICSRCLHPVQFRAKHHCLLFQKKRRHPYLKYKKTYKLRTDGAIESHV
uniref:Uncharacterized protein n=1 Tax=Arundo donax TaxID=35708 RepID=A0A0A9G5M4_ARUDO